MNETNLDQLAQDMQWDNPDMDTGSIQSAIHGLSEGLSILAELEDDEWCDGLFFEDDSDDWDTE